MRLPALAAATLATVAIATACGSSSGGLIPFDTAGSLKADLNSIRAGVRAGDCQVTDAAIETAQSDFENLPSGIDPHLRSQLVAGFTTLETSAQLECQQTNPGGSTGSTGTSSSSTSSSTSTSTSTSTTTTTTTATSSAATTATSSAATTSTDTGPTCTLVTTPNGGTVCEGATGDNGIGGGGGIGGPGN